jgi:CRISPR system Cascade subunit CasE
MGQPDATPVTPEERRMWREHELASWLERHGKRGGFEVETCIPGPTMNRRIVRRVRKRERPITLHEVELTGVLRVTDATAFAESCAHGIGRGKAFGFGLLMVRHL